jgi:transketolase
MRALPNFEVLSPADHVSADALFDRCIKSIKPKYLRFDAQVLPVIYEAGAPNLDIGFHVHRQGSGLCLLATGYMVHTALKVAERLFSAGHIVGIVDLIDIANFDADAMELMLSQYKALVTMEEGFRGRGGIDSMMFEFIARRHLNIPLLNIGVEGGYRFELGSRDELHEQVGIGINSVENAITNYIKTLSI